MNEEVIENPVFTANAIEKQKKKIAYSIVDEEIIKHYEEKGLDLINVVTSGMDMSYFRQEEEEAKKNGSDVLFIADSIEKLAEKTGINVENLKNTVETYNSYCSSKDELFHKNPKYLLPIKGFKYYALKLDNPDYAFVLPGNSLGFALNS